MSHKLWCEKHFSSVDHGWAIILTRFLLLRYPKFRPFSIIARNWTYFGWNLTIFAWSLVIFSRNLSYFDLNLTIFAWNLIIFAWKLTYFCMKFDLLCFESDYFPVGNNYDLCHVRRKPFCKYAPSIVLSICLVSNSMNLFIWKHAI